MANPRVHYAWFIMAAGAAIYAASVGIIVSSASILYRAVAKDFGVGLSSISLYTTIMYLVITVLLPFAGKILQRFDARFVLAIAGVLDAGAFALMGTYHTAFPFYLSGVVLGVASTFLIYGTIPLVMNNWFKTRIGLSLGIAMAFMGIGGVIFSQVTGHLIGSIGWRMTYVTLGIIVAVLTIPVSLLVMRAKPEDKGLQPYGIETVDANAPVATVAETGVMRAQAKNSPAFYLVIIFTGLLGLAATVSFHIPNFAQSIGFSATVAATGVTCVTIGQTGGKFLLGAVNDKFGVRAALITGIGGGLIGVLILLSAQSTGLAGVYVGALLFGIGFSGSTLLPPVVIREVFGGRDYASIYTTIMSASTLGLAFGTTIFSMIYDRSGSYYLVFIVEIVIFVVVAASSLVSLRWKKILNV